MNGSRASRLGAIDAFVQDAQMLLNALRELVTTIAGNLTAQTTSICGNLGPELWLLNTDFLMIAIWEKERSVPLAVNLNTATEAEFMTVPGIDRDLGKMPMLS